MRELIDQKMGRIREYLTIVRTIQDDCLERFTKDPIYKGALLHYLYMLADSCISLAELIIRKQGLRPPQSYHEAFDILGENRILEREFAYRFARIAGFRNLLAHDYEKVDPKYICEGILSRLPEIDTFLRQIEQAVS
jgi:uncharacterized protein YutE (UPF0331/DUF86 family)